MGSLQARHRIVAAASHLRFTLLLDQHDFSQQRLTSFGQLPAPFAICGTAPARAIGILLAKRFEFAFWIFCNSSSSVCLADSTESKSLDVAVGNQIGLAARKIPQLLKYGELLADQFSEQIGFQPVVHARLSFRC